MTEWSPERQAAGDNALAAFHEALRRANPGVKLRPRRVRKPITSSEAEVARTREILGSVTVAGAVHAAYPTALNALCGLRRVEVDLDPRGPVPGCSDCVHAAARCAEIDNSAPRHWKIRQARSRV